jgi:hypothetical protein
MAFTVRELEVDFAIDGQSASVGHLFGQFLNSLV